MRRLLTVVSACVLALTMMLPATAARPFPEVIRLPNGFQPEGIAIGPGPTFYVGSIPTGAIYKGSLVTGKGALLVQPVEGRQAIGLGLDLPGRRLFVAGGPTGDGYVYDTRTGETIATYDFTSGDSFVNDVVVTHGAAYFTDSSQPVIYRVDLRWDGAPTGEFTTIPLGGDFDFVPGAFNLNGIEATWFGTTLIAVSSTLGALYAIDPDTGEATLIDLGGATMTNGDGLLLIGRTLYVVQNRLNQISVIRLSHDFTSGEVIDVITNPNFDVPTTIDHVGPLLYAVNARFGTTPTPDTDYTVVRASLR